MSPLCSSPAFGCLSQGASSFASILSGGAFLPSNSGDRLRQERVPSRSSLTSPEPARLSKYGWQLVSALSSRHQPYCDGACTPWAHLQSDLERSEPPADRTPEWGAPHDATGSPVT